MSLKQIGILFSKEIWQGSRGFIFIWAVIMPLLLSLVLSAVFGTLFSEKPKLGIVDEEDSQLTTMIEELDSLDYREYSTQSEIRQAVENGAVDVGVVIPDGFDNAVMQGDEAEITAYIWGESLAKNRTILLVTVANLIREMTGQEAPVDIETVTLGDDEIIPFEHGLKLYEQAHAPKKFLEIRGSHNEGFFISINEYKKEVQKFIRENFK